MTIPRVSPRKTAVVIAAAVLTVLTTSVAWAFWSSTGRGTATASTATISSPTVTLPATAGPTVHVAWTPGSAPGPGVRYFVQRLTAQNAVQAACGTSAAATIVTTSCDDAVSVAGSYTYKTTAVFNSWTAISSAAGPVQVTTAAPTVTMTSPANGTSTANNKPTYSGTASDTSAVTVNVYTGASATGTPRQLTTTPSGGSWSVNGTTALADGTYTVTASQTNAAGTTTTSGNTFAVDTTAPTVTINQASGQPDPTNTSPINYTVVFSEPVTGFTSSGVTVGGTSGGSKTATVTGSGSTYTVAIAGMTSGTVTATVNPAAAHDAAGNTSTASTSTDNTVTYNPVTATKLAFGIQPSTTQASSAISPSPTVQIQDANGNVISSSTASVTVAITGSTGATLSGTTTVNAVNGVATFTGLSINKSGTYTLSASSTGLPGTTSSSFTINNAALTTLTFTSQPSSTPRNTGFSISVTATDQFGNPVSGVTVTLGLNNPNNVNGANLNGTTSATTSTTGIATLTGLTINKAGTFTLSATSGSVHGTSSTFTVS